MPSVSSLGKRQQARRVVPAPPLPSARQLVFTLVVVAFALYGHTLQYPFVYDDDSFIVSNESIRDLNHWREFFSDPGTLASDTELAHDNYRPLVTLSYALNYAFG